MSETRYCKQCKRHRPVEAFLWGALRIPRIRVTKCMDCASANMAAWAKTSLRRFNADEIKEVNDD